MAKPRGRPTIRRFAARPRDRLGGEGLAARLFYNLCCEMHVNSIYTLISVLNIGACAKYRCMSYHDRDEVIAQDPELSWQPFSVG